MLNSRFSIHVHIVSLLAISSEPITSEYIASSVNCNPVLIRKELSALKKAGFITTLEGKKGGILLSKKAKNIHLDDLFKITYDGASLFSENKNVPNPLCRVGRNISATMQRINEEAELSLLQKLQQRTIADLITEFE